jgi:cytochrome b subunit of formate dehydrogenase
MYSQMDGINNFSKAISYIFMILFFVGFVSGLQLYSLELMFVFQYAYSGLLTINKL